MTGDLQDSDIKHDVRVHETESAVADSPGPGELFTDHLVKGSLGTGSQSGDALAKLVPASWIREEPGPWMSPKGGRQWKSDYSARW